MKIMLLYGSPHKEGCSAEILKIARRRFESAGLETETFWIGNEPVSGCLACKRCAVLGRCTIDDPVNVFLEHMRACDALMMACPVHFGAPPGTMVSFLDRAFYVARRHGNLFAGMPAAAIVSARRMGTTSTLDILNRFITCMEMPLVTGRYWPAVHGQRPEEIYQDEEGVQTICDITDNMIWLLQCKEIASGTGIRPPDKVPLAQTHFIRH